MFVSVICLEIGVVLTMFFSSKVALFVNNSLNTINRHVENNIQTKSNEGAVANTVSGSLADAVD
eukprot:3676453-Ditylum_brightwellii.AAC.1